MAGDKFDQLYNALKADGAVSGTREHFRQFVYAPGKQGYHNRKQLYDALHADGAVSSNSYEEFAQRLGLHAVNPKPQQQKPVQPVKKQTMKQRAQEVAAQYQKSRQQKAQQPRTATTSGTDYMQNWQLMHMRNDQMNPMQQAQASNARARMQRAQEQSARQEQQRATPISRSRITPTAKNFNETMQQLSTPEARQARAKQQREDDARALAQYEVEGNKFVRNDGQTEGILGNDLLSLVDSSMNEAQELTRQQYQQNLDKMGGIYAPQSVKEQAFRDAQTQELVNRQNVLMNNLSSKINEIYSQKGMQRHIAESAEKLNMGVEEYVDKYVTPEIMNYAQKALTMRNQEEIMPHGALDYIAKNLSNSIIGMVVAPSVMSRDTRQRLQEGIAIADGDAEIQKVAGHKDETYRSGIGTRFASTAVNMAADSGPLAVIGAGASAAANTGTRVLTNGLVKAGVMKAAQKLTAQQMAFKVANMTTAQKIMSGLGTRTATGALNLAGYSGVTAALNQASTGDDTSLQAIGEAGLKGAEHGAVTGAMFGISGAIMSPWVSKFGITGMEKSTGERLLHGAQKFGATATGLGVEAGTMMVADNVTGDKDISFGTWLEDVVMVGAFKAGEPSNFVKMGNILHHLTHNSGGNFVIGKNANGSPIAVDIRLTPDEKNELISSASGKNLMDAFVKVDRASKTAPRDPKYKTAYTDFMNDPDVSQSTKEKVNAAMGLFNTTRGKSYRSVNDVKNKQILEYTKNGTLLTRTSYKNADERRAILYKQKLYRDNDDMLSLIGYSKMKDMQLTDEDGNVTSLALGFLKENGYDENKDITDPKNAQLINDLRNPKSALYLDWEKYVDKNGLYGYLKAGSTEVAGGFLNAMKEIINDKGQMIVDIDKIMRKDPMKRTDKENEIFYHVKRALEDDLFPSGKPHADQSASQGKTVAEENKIGTDNPEGGVVVDELRNLHNAEQAVDEAMESNDVFNQTFEKLHQQGLTPAQIYDALIQNGLTEEELTPLAQYINANARVQGMQQATADAIEENVKSFVSDWSYHGTLNGQPMNGEQALYVQDSNGRTLLVGSGDVAFDQTTGRAKEGSGDMLVCFDPNTKEMVYVKADEVTLFQNQPIDQFTAEYRQRLQMKNSEPYNQAAQEQAMQDAAKAQQKQGTANISENTGSEPRPQNEPKNEISSENQEVNEGRKPGAEEPRPQPQPTRKFADGSDVPMATDSKGRPTPDYEKMTPEQSAEILTEDFGENAEKVVDGQIQKAEKALKDAEKMKVDYTAEPNDIMEQEALKNQTIEAAKKQLDHAQNIKKAMTAKKVAETVGSTEQTEGAHEAGSVAAQKFVNAPRLVGNKRTRMLADGETKIRGHYEIVPAESLTPSHDVNNGYKKSEGFPTDAEGRTVNDRDYEHDKAAQQNTDQIARKYNGMAIEQVPVVSDEGIVYDGNGRTMAGQKAAKDGTDGEYINDLLENAENFGFTREQIEQSGIKHPRLVMVTDERLPYDTATFSKFNRNEKKTQSNTEQAVAKAKTLTSDEVGAIVAEIEGNGSLDAFFNNSKAINDLVKTLVDKGIIGQNEVAQMMDSPERLSAQGREYVKNLLLGSIFKPETIRMLGIDYTVKNKAINAIRSVMDNMKLGEFSLRDEIDQAIQLLYEARQGGNKVDTLLRTPDMFGEDAAKRYSSISQMMALALEGKVSDFRDLLDEYNRIAKARNTGEGNMFEAAPTKEELINEYLNFKKWQDYGTGHSENEGSNDVSGIEEPQQEASGGNEPAEAGTEPERPRVEEPEVGTLPLLPKEEKPDPTFDPIEAAAAEFKKEHPLTEEEIMKADVDDVVKDMALDYLNGEVTDDLHRAIYESIFAKTREQKAEQKIETPKAEPSADPMEGIKNAAEEFEKEKKAKAETEKKPQQTADDAAVSASNKKVNDLWKELMNAGKDELSASFVGLNSRQLELLPKLVGAMAENAYLRIKRGMHNLEDVVKEMRKEFAPAAKVFKKEDVDAIYEQMMNIRYRDGEQRMSLKEWADYYEKTSPKHQENLVGDSKTAEERKLAEKKFIDTVNIKLGFKHKFNGIVELRKIAERVGLKDIKDTDLQELAETAIVKRARGIASSESTNNAEKFKRIKTLYENQPSLNQRDSERVMKQQYSTPAPYAFLADMYVKGNGKVIESALEPSAGNGMLTIGLPKDKVHVNDIDDTRLLNLNRQGFGKVTSQDGTQPFADKDVDVVVTNPPFGSATPKEYDGYKISSLEGQMAINALESMKDDGRAAIIIGGKTEYAKNGSLNPKDKAFLGYLYSHYNVEDVINVDGGLYAKQGTSYPTRIILINGRRLDENAFPPVKDKARAETVKDYDELYKRIEDDILRGERMDSSIGKEGGNVNAGPDKQGAAGAPKEGVRTGERGGSEPDGKRGSDVSDTSSVSGTHDDLENQRGTEPREDGRLSDGDTGADGTGAEPTPNKEPTAGANDGRGAGSGGAGGNDTQPSTDEPASAGSGSGPRGQLQRVDKSIRGLSTEKVTYTPKSGNPFTLKAVMPADQQEAVNKNLEKLGDADQFLVDELGYNDKDDLYSHLAAEQVDSVALALQQAKKGNAFIIGDMTGIGKGRQAASLIRYAKKQGQVPVYFTKTAGLLSDVYRDLVDIGSPELRPFVFGSAKEAAITDSDGKVVFALPSKSEVKRVLDYIEKNGKLPDEYDYVLTTYSQVSNGVYEFDENGSRKEKKLAKGKKFGAAALSGQRRRDAIEKLMDNAYLILDESHTAGGNSGQGNYFQHIIQKAKNVTFFSATFAKRPDNMPIYALRTAMNEGGMKSSDLIDAVKRGGATLQEIMSQTLTQCGQMIRRERDMTGVTIDWKAIDDPERVQEQREQYDSIIGLFNDIINFQKKYVSSYVDERNDELAAIQSTMGIKKGTAALGIKNQPFASKAFNTVQQVLLSLKAKSAAERAIDYLKQGMKPVIALNNTNESQTGNFALGEEMDAPDLGTSLKKGLEGTLRYTKKDAKDNSESGYINLADLGDEAVEAYHELEKKIEQTSTGLSLSPIDVIKNELEKAGYKVGELTGRQTEFVYNENGTVTKIKRADTDKKKLARDFNDGKIDALILNKSAATGISLHASSKYKDQKKRVMIVAQQQLDVNDEVQMRGRIDRTGQVARGAYEYVVSLIPAEQRLLMMFKAKLKSLDANTTSSQKSKFNEMEVADITNKYGDKVVREYMAEHLDLYARMADPFGWEKSLGEDLSRIDPQRLVAEGGGVGDGEAGADASKLLGRMALLRVSEQEKMLQEIGELYANEIRRLNEMGENDLEITELPLKAKTIRKEVWKQGAEPGGDNAFADNTYIEKVNMAILKKPMKAAEVKASQEGLTGGKTWEEYKAEKKTAVKEYFDQKIADETQRYEERAVKVATKAKEKYIKDAKKGQKDSGMSDEQIEKMAGYQYDNIYKQEKDKLNDVVKNLKAKAEMFDRVLDTFDTNETFVLPTDMNNPNELSGFGNSYGRLIDIKITDNFSPNASTVSFATLDGRRKITFPIAGKVGSGENKVDVIGSIDRMTKQAAGMGDNHIKVLNQDLNNWDRLTSNESRKDGYIVTGNLMQALVDSKDQGLGGQLVKYTTDTGEVKTGILMPDHFDPKGLTTDAPINSVADKFELSSWHGGIDEVTSSDGEVKVKRIDNNRGNYYELRVQKSKAKGGKYFLDKDLLKLVNGNNFETRGNNMLAEFKPEQLKPVLDRLSKMGVKVQEERKTSEDMSDAPNETSFVATGSNNRGLEKKPLLDVEPVDPVVWMREHPGQLPTTTDLFGQPHVEAQLGKELGSRVLGVTDAGVKMSRIDYEGGYVIRADGNNHDYVAQTYYPDGQIMTRTNYDIGMDGGQLKKYVKFDKNGIPYSTIDDAIKNFMENMGKPKQLSSDNGVHFREEDPQEIELPKDEYAVLAHTIDSSHKNYKRGKVNYEYTADNFYVFKYNKYNDYNVYQKIPIDGNEELINYIKDGINKETIRNPRDIDSALEAGWNGRNGHYWDSTSNQEGRGGSVRFGEVSSLRSRNGRPSDERMGEELSDSPSSAVNNYIERIAKKTGGKVKMVSSVDEITNKAAKAAIEDGRKITGWYDEKTGEVHLYMPNIHDRYTAEKTIWHEVVGHKGMRELFGDERFDKFLRDVWYDLDKPENAALKKLVDEERKYNPLNIYDAIEEGIARLAEDGKGEAGFWNGIKNKVSDFLHEIGYRIAPNTKDVKYLLWLSKNLQKNPNDPYWKMRAEAVKYRLDHERMPAVVAHDGMFYGNDGKVRSMDSLTKSEWDEATDGQIHFRTTPSAGTALDRYHRSLDEHGYMFTESYMDNMLSLKKLMNAIVPDKKIEDIASSENPYILQNTMQGAMSDAAQMFERNVMKPLDKAMADVLDAFDGKKDDEKIRNFNLYMITKHGLERNREFFVRDFLKQMRMDEQKKQDADFLENSYYSDKEYLDNELKSGNIDLKEYYRQLDESIRNHFDADFEAGEHDYSGMHAIQEVAKYSDPYNDAEAIQSVMDSEAKMESIKKGAVKDYWDKVKAATQYSIDSDYKNGIISKELHGHVSNMFNWYVPLRKYDEATAEDTYGYITEQGDPKSYIGSTIMRARGHKYLSETNVLAQIGAMGNRAIKNGGMNAIRQAFARFARNNSGNNLITETSVWYEKDPVVNIVYERYPDIPEGATADEINQIVSDFNKDMKMKESQGLAYKVYRRDKIGYKFQKAENKSQHIVDVKIAGRTHTFIINGNPRAAQALNGLLENSGAKGIMKPLSYISRMMAQLCTSYNPEFVMRNIMRDAEFASSNVTSKEGARYGALWAKYYAQLGFYKGASTISFKDLSGTTGLGLFAKYRKGTLDMSDKVQRYFKEFMENGGETGWVQIKNMQDWTKEYKKDVKSERSKIDKGGAALHDFFFGNLSNINEVAENIARFATYCASRDSNRSIIRSVYDAKEVSTNFNRHGSGDAIKSFKNGEMTGGKAAARWAYGFTASYLRHCSMFFNAGIQSTNLLAKNLKNHPVGTSINMLAIPFAIGALAALGNNVLISSEDEKDRKGVKDPYGELPDYVRRNNLCIYKGGGEFVTIPLAIELRAFYGLGDLAAGLTFSTNVSGQKNPALDAVGCMSQLVPVIDYLGNSSAGKEPLNETIKAISPSALSPFVEWELNTDWKGAPIERRGDWNENSPAWQRAYKGVPDGYMALNKWVNAQTNDVAKGNEDMLGNSFLDMVTNPSMLNHYIGGIGGGAATFTERLVGVIKHGSDTGTQYIPFLRSLLYMPSEQSSLQRTKSKWYNYKDEMEKTMANVDRLKSKNVPLDKRITNIGEYYQFQNSKEAAKVRVIELAEKQMKRWKKMRDKASDTESINFANQNIDRIMMDAVDELDRLE
jgi:hypothetical protein